jgi:hypothetical protein
MKKIEKAQDKANQAISTQSKNYKRAIEFYKDHLSLLREGIKKFSLPLKTN